MASFCKKNGIVFTAYSPLGNPESPLRTGDERKVLEDPLVLEIAEKVGKTPGQVLIRWAVQRETVVIPKSVNPARIVENLDVLDWAIPEDLFERLSTIEY